MVRIGIGDVGDRVQCGVCGRKVDVKKLTGGSGEQERCGR